MSGRYRVLSHTADTGIDVEADSLDELFEWAARGMFELMFDVSGHRPERTTVVEVQGAGTADLLVDTLSDLLYRSEVDDVLPCHFDTIAVDSRSVTMQVGTVPLRPDMLEGPPIKAVTYHDLVVDRRADGSWRAQVFFDV